MALLTVTVILHNARAVHVYSALYAIVRCLLLTVIKYEITQNYMIQ